jgi:hypothetical protein
VLGGRFRAALVRADRAHDESFHSHSHVEVVQSVNTVAIDITPDESGPCDDPEIVGQRRALGLS